jgi:hypothetical protein
VNSAARDFIRKKPRLGRLPRNALFTVDELLAEYADCGYRPPSRKATKEGAKPQTDQEYSDVLRAEISRHRKRLFDLLLHRLERHQSIKQLRERLYIDSGFWKFDEDQPCPQLATTRWPADASAKMIYGVVRSFYKSTNVDASAQKEIALDVVEKLYLTYLRNIEAWLAQQAAKSGTGIWGFAKNVVDAALIQDWNNRKVHPFESLSDADAVTAPKSPWGNDGLLVEVDEVQQQADLRAKAGLSERQWAIVEHQRKGKSSKQIQEALNISPSVFYRDNVLIRKKIEELRREMD